MQKDYFKGRGAQIAASNPFTQRSYHQEYVEGLDEELQGKPETKFFIDHPKSIVSTNDSPDLKLTHSINPYQGCEHGCTYCYARNSHAYWGFNVGFDFESKIIVKENAPELLEKTFRKRSWKPTSIMLSGNTDCYQPAERKFKITRRLLEVFLKFRNPVGIITKNSLIQRDLDLLKELAARRLVHVFFSITTFDEQLRQKMEPRTASTKKRFGALKSLAENSVPTGIMTAPIIPSLNDHEIPRLLKRASEAGALSAGYTMVRLNGQISQIFKDWIHTNFPDRAPKVISHIEGAHGGDVRDSQWGRRMTGEGEMAENINRMFHLFKDKYFKGKEMPDHDLTSFNRSGMPMLF